MHVEGGGRRGAALIVESVLPALAPTLEELWLMNGVDRNRYYDDIIKKRVRSSEAAARTAELVRLVRAIRRCGKLTYVLLGANRFNDTVMEAIAAEISAGCLPLLKQIDLFDYKDITLRTDKGRKAVEDAWKAKKKSAEGLSVRLVEV